MRACATRTPQKTVKRWQFLDVVHGPFWMSPMPSEKERSPKNESFCFESRSSRLWCMIFTFLSFFQLTELKEGQKGCAAYIDKGEGHNGWHHMLTYMLINTKKRAARSLCSTRGCGIFAPHKFVTRGSVRRRKSWTQPVQESDVVRTEKWFSSSFCQAAQYSKRPPKSASFCF